MCLMSTFTQILALWEWLPWHPGISVYSLNPGTKGKTKSFFEKLKLFKWQHTKFCFSYKTQWNCPSRMNRNQLFWLTQPTLITLILSSSSCNMCYLRSNLFISKTPLLSVWNSLFHLKFFLSICWHEQTDHIFILCLNNIGHTISFILNVWHVLF